MSVRYRLKQGASNLLCHPTLNVFLRKALRSSGLEKFISRSFLRRLPVVGAISLHPPGSKPFELVGEGGDTILNGIYWLGWENFEPTSTRLFLQLLPHVRTVLDIGANTGLYGLLAAVNEPGRQVYAFEPVPEVFRTLQRNGEHNRLSNLHPFQLALTDRNGEMDLYIPEAVFLPVSSSAAAGFRPATRTISVSGLTLYSFELKEGLRDIDLIKLDTESTEPAVLRGARSTLAQHTPLIICEVLTDACGAAIQQLLEPLGYRFFLIASGGLTRRATLVSAGEAMNYLFIAPRWEKIVHALTTFQE